jgi:uncharacterized membrane protein YbaN (DUF454 family)
VRAAIKRIVLLIVGWGFIFLGIIGLFLPVLQGILFILVGLIILSAEYTWAHRLLEKAKARFPRVARRAGEASERARRWLRRFGRRET